MTDQELAIGIAAGRRDALEVLIERHHRPLLRYLWQAGGSKEDAEDLAAQALLRVRAEIKGYRGEGSLSGWIFRVAYRELLRHRRRQALANLIRPSGEKDDPTDDTIVLTQALSRLPLNQRSAFLLTEVEGLTTEEAARALGIPPGTVKSRCHHARLRLRNLLALPMEKPMQNLPPNDEAFIQTLKAVDTPAPRSDLIKRLEAEPQRRSRPWMWTLSLSAAGGSATALVVLFSLPPAISVAQVAKALQAHQQYTVVNTRILDTKGHSFKVTFYRDGPVWRSGNTIGLRDRTVSIFNMPDTFNFVQIDGPSFRDGADLRVDALLRAGVKPTVKTNIDWHGRRADRFRIKDTYRATPHAETLEQELIVDAKTMLPIRNTIMRDSRNWGDVWDYDFTKPDPSVFNYQIPKGATIYDLREQRKSLDKLVAHSPTGAIVMDEPRQIVMLLPAGSPQGWFVRLRLDSVKDDLRGYFVDDSFFQEPKLGRVVPTMVRVGGKDWHLFRFSVERPEWAKLDKLRGSSSATGTFNAGKETIELRKVPVFHTSQAQELLRPLRISGGHS